VSFFTQPLQKKIKKNFFLFDLLFYADIFVPEKTPNGVYWKRSEVIGLV